MFCLDWGGGVVVVYIKIANLVTFEFINITCISFKGNIHVYEIIYELNMYFLYYELSLQNRLQLIANLCDAQNS